MPPPSVPRSASPADIPAGRGVTPGWGHPAVDGRLLRASTPRRSRSSRTEQLASGVVLSDVGSAALASPAMPADPARRAPDGHTVFLDRALDSLLVGYVVHCFPPLRTRSFPFCVATSPPRRLKGRRPAIQAVTPAGRPTKRRDGLTVVERGGLEPLESPDETRSWKAEAVQGESRPGGGSSAGERETERLEGVHVSGTERSRGVGADRTDGTARGIPDEGHTDADHSAISLRRHRPLLSHDRFQMQKTPQLPRGGVTAETGLWQDRPAVSSFANAAAGREPTARSSADPDPWRHLERSRFSRRSAAPPPPCLRTPGCRQGCASRRPPSWPSFRR